MVQGKQGFMWFAGKKGVSLKTYWIKSFSPLPTVSSGRASLPQNQQDKVQALACRSVTIL